MAEGPASSASSSGHGKGATSSSSSSGDGEGSSSGGSAVRNGRGAFRTLAGYLFGGNDRKESMNMTTPVFTSSAGRMQFVVGKADKVGFLRVRTWLHLAFRTAQQSPAAAPAACSGHRQGRHGGSQNKGCFAKPKAGWLPGVNARQHDMRPSR